MTLLWDNDSGAAERYNYAVGGDIHRIDTSVALMRTLEDSPRENLVIIGPDVDMQSACDLSESIRNSAIAWLEAHGASPSQIALVREGGALDERQEEEVFGESLPPGLHLSGETD